MPGPLVAALIGAGATVATNIWSARRADTAHQREARDLRAAGLNPQLSVGRGAPSQPMADPGEGAASAVAVARARSEVQLLEAQARREDATARLAATQADEISTYAPGRGALVQMQTALAAANERQVRELFPVLLEKAKEEIALVASSAQAARARAMLDEAARAGALNEEEFQKLIGEMGPWAKMINAALRIIGGSR